MNQPIGLLPRKLLLRKVLLGVTAAGAVAGLAFFGWSAKAKDDATYQLANGVKVTPFIVRDEGLSQLLDAKIWKFNIALPDHTKSYDYSLVVYKHGKIIETAGGLETGPVPGGTRPSSDQLTVAMMPLSTGNLSTGSFQESRQAKYSIRAYGAGTEGVFANPLKGCYNYTIDSQVYQEDNSIYLMSGTQTKHNQVGPSDVTIALSIQPAAQPIVTKK